MTKGTPTTVFAMLICFMALTSAYGQQSFTLSTSGNKALPKNTLDISNIVNVTAPGNTSSYLQFKASNIFNRTDTLDLSIQSSNDNIIPSGDILLIDSSNYYYDHPDTSFTVELEITLSSGSCSQYELFAYTFTNSPPEVTNQEFTIPENPSSRDTLGQITSSDPDGDPLWYELLTTNPASAVALDERMGILTVADSSLYNHEQTPSIKSTIAVSDGWVRREMEVTIEVSNMNEPPVLIKDTFQIEQQAPVGTTLGSVKASDEDMDPIHFSIASGSLMSYFDINEAGDITIIKTLEQLPPPPHEVRIAASDGTYDIYENYPIEVSSVLKNERHTIEIYPNPVTDYLHLASKASHSTKIMALTDLSGKNYAFSYNNHKLNFSHLSSGVYLLTVSVNNHIEIFQIIKH
ncbi:T9SS type A sorting domain-containing protein [Marinoscillum furvescens]|uniref:Putative secreted protein (Por secretion system target) n=1 Tax=Marinoscillum furvescens DSM 4134 TaxID=1122208 RepID=A0A3D9KX81_MARFU|nr:T9SS type A sorting domain-containing protein [Marinoscillum furvescens]RED93208.1 putative secreted protein (Por secretion system target) [Marinoscillum furvescens DSM 4134]